MALGANDLFCSPCSDLFIESHNRMLFVMRRVKGKRKFHEKCSSQMNQRFIFPVGIGFPIPHIIFTDAEMMKIKYLPGRLFKAHLI